MSSIPTSYDILPNDFINHQGYMAQFGGSFDTGSGGPHFYPQSLDGALPPLFPKPTSVSYSQFPDGGLAPAFQTYQAVPQFQPPPSFTRTPSSSSESSLGYTWTPSQDPSFGNIPQLYPELENNPAPVPVVAPPAKRKGVITAPRHRGPNKRPPGTGFADLMDQLPLEVQIALNMTYEGCCSTAKNMDNSTRQKHIFSNRHCSKLGAHLQEAIPSFVCPAFIALHGKCKSAKAGRYDSTERHCRTCGGYDDINRKVSVFPVQVTKGEHRAIQAFRTNANPDEETVRHVQNSIRKVLVMMIEGGMTLEPESDAPHAMDVTAEQPSFLESEGDDELGPDDMLYF